MIPKQSIKSTTQWVKKKRMKVVQWSSQSLDVNLIKMLWRDFKRAVHKRMPANLNILKQCKRLIKSYRDCYFRLLLLKVALRTIESFWKLSVLQICSLGYVFNWGRRREYWNGDYSRYQSAVNFWFSKHVYLKHRKQNNRREKLSWQRDWMRFSVVK